MASHTGLSHVLAHYVVCLSNYKLGKALTLSNYPIIVCLCQNWMKSSATPSLRRLLFFKGVYF